MHVKVIAILTTKKHNYPERTQGNNSSVYNVIADIDISHPSFKEPLYMTEGLGVQVKD